MDQFNESQILFSLKNGDHQAYTVLFDRYWKMVFNLVYKKTCDKQVALDITQDIFTMIWEKRTQLKVNGLIGAWLSGIVKYKVIDWYRNTGKLEQQKKSFLSMIRHDNPLHREPEFVHSGYNNIYSRWLQCVNHLPARTKEIYTLSNIEGRSVSEIARYLSIKPQSVKNHLVKAGVRVRKEMEAYVETTISATALAFVLLTHYGNN